VYIFQSKRFNLVRYYAGTIPIVLLLAIGCLIYSTTAGLIIGSIAAAMVTSLWATSQLSIPVHIRGKHTYFQIKEGPEGVKTTNNKAVPHFGPTQTFLVRAVPIRNKDAFSLPFGEADEREKD
jgi:hypothetical protein